MNGIYPATLRHMKGFAVLLLFLAGLAVISPALTGGLSFAAFNLAVVAFTIWRFRKMALCFTEEGIIYHGWIFRREIPYSLIVKVVQPAKAAWPRDRIPPSVYEIISKTGRVQIDLNWFGPDGSRAFRKRILQVRTKSD